MVPNIYDMGYLSYVMQAFMRNSSLVHAQSCPHYISHGNTSCFPKSFIELLLPAKHFADDIVLVTPDISQAERLLADFDKACGKIGLRLNLKKAMFMRNGLVSFAPFTLNGTNISDAPVISIYFGKSI
uniref:Reverse transcriptase domain-containing protein n=1 Tax=Angiostrongylus cantonensis TaxID=6313 RepID=A0A0K0D761_ANGCA